MLLQTAVEYHNIFSVWFRLLFQISPTFFSEIVHNFANFFVQFNIWVLLIAFVLIWGFNFSFWGVIGLIRWIHENSERQEQNKAAKKASSSESRVTLSEVAALVPAHNEALVIKKTIDSLLRLLSADQIFVVSDGSKDGTAHVARQTGVKVLDSKTPSGKAGALEKGLKHFKLTTQFKAVMFVDADSILDIHHLEHALPYFDDPGVGVVANYASTLWQPRENSWLQLFFIAYRERVYFFSQLFIKYGQSWRHSNVVFIAPGFASVYRSEVLEKIDINPGGLVIEDFNMTFEVHHQKLGRIAHSPSVIAYTQDPDNFFDYYRQIRRWDLGFWQTVRRHGIWVSKFWFATTTLLVEVSLSAIMILFLPLAISLSVLNAAWPALLPLWLLPLTAYLTLKTLFFAIWLPDYCLSLLLGLFRRRPEYIYLGLGFLFLRFVDGFLFIFTLPKAFFVNSSGHWVSPTRRS